LWSEPPPVGLGIRATFDPFSTPAALRIDRVKSDDAGAYRCRVDFRTAQTRNTIFNLTVIGRHFTLFTC
jgi:hypothetical protein